MRPLMLALIAVSLSAGCLSTAALTRGAKRIHQTVTPAAEKIGRGSRRLVHAAGMAADDAALGAKVKAMLMLRKGLDSRGIRVHCEAGAARLTGTVPTADQKRLATEGTRA